MLGCSSLSPSLRASNGGTISSRTQLREEMSMRGSSLHTRLMFLSGTVLGFTSYASLPAPAEMNEAYPVEMMIEEHPYTEGGFHSDINYLLPAMPVITRLPPADREISS